MEIENQGGRPQIVGEKAKKKKTYIEFEKNHLKYNEKICSCIYKKKHINIFVKLLVNNKMVVL